MNQKIRIAVVDDHEIVRRGIIGLIQHNSLFEVVIAAENGQDLLEQMTSITPNIVLLDIQMPVMNGQETLKILVKTWPDTRVVMFSLFFDEMIVREFIEMGASAFLPKNCSYEELITSVERVYHEGSYYSDEVCQILGSEQPVYERANDRKKAFSSRELEVLHLLSLNYTNEKISELLHINIRTVEFHRKNLMKKSGTINLAAAIVFAISNNLIPGSYQHPFGLTSAKT